MSRDRAADVGFSEIALIRGLHKHRRGLFALVYLGFVAYSTLLPFDFHWSTGHRSFLALGETFRIHNGEENLADLVLNVLLYVPLGASICLAVRHRLERWGPGFLIGFFAGGLLSVTIESLQMFSASRVGSTTDMLTNTSGTVIGCLMAPGIRLVLRHFRRRRREMMAEQPLWHLCTWAAVSLLVCGLVPFDIREDLGQLREGLLSAHVRPFWQLTQPADAQPAASSGPAAFWVDFAGQAGAFLLFAALMTLTATAEARLGMIAAVFITLWSGIGLAIVVEVSQIMIASRGFDTTDVIAAALGVGGGAIAGAVTGRLAVRHRWKWGQAQPLIGVPVLAIVALGQAGYLTALGLEPFRFGPFPQGDALWSAIGLVPFRGYAEHLTPVLVAEFVLKFVRYALLGVLVMLALRRVWSASAKTFARCAGVTVGGVMLLSAAIEIIQLSIPGRYCDVTDVVIAGMGALSGGTAVQWYADGVAYARSRVRRSSLATPLSDVPTTHSA